MDSTEQRITFDNMPQAVATLLDKVQGLKTLTENLTTYGGFSSQIPSRTPGEVYHLRLGQPQLHPASHVRQISLLLPSGNRQMAQETMKTAQKEPRSIKDILLDIAEDPNDDCGKTLRRLPCIQKGLNERRSRRQDDKK